MNTSAGRKPLKAIFFDFDGTLVNSEPLHFQMWQQVLAAYGVGLTVEQYKEHYAGVPTTLNAEDMVRRFALPVPYNVISDAKITHPGGRCECGVSVNAGGAGHTGAFFRP